MSQRASPSCHTCGNPLPPGAAACPHDGTPVPGDAPAPRLQADTLLSPTLRSARPPVPAEPPVPAPRPETLEAMVGQRLGEYVVHRHVGSGGMGVVYEGEHLTIGLKVAIKFIREELTQGPHARGLLAEARAAGAIRHPGIIDIFGFGHQPGIGQYLVMEYLEGWPLSEVITERAPLPLGEVLSLLGEVLDALSAAHAAGVIHRDLKPSNIFVARQSNGAESIKVLDFGLAKRAQTPDGTSPQTQSNMIVGTPQYMAPEQALGEEVGPRTDLYAIGVIAFELLTGRRLFQGRTNIEVVAHHLRSPAPAPSSFVPVPPELDALILRLLSKTPEQRPASASEVARELRALGQSQEGSGVSSARLHHPIAGARPPSDERPAQAGTASLIPVTPPPVEGGAAGPSARGGRWRWGAVAGGGLALALGIGALLRREPVTRVPEAPPATPVALAPAPAQPVPAPEAPPRDSAPQQSPAPALEPGASAGPTMMSRVLPAKKKRAPEPVRPAPAAASVPAAVEPLPAPLTPSGSAPVVVQAGTGTLHLLVRGGWADVWVDGQRLGRVPPQNSYLLIAGEHGLELRNPAFAPHRAKLVVPANGTVPHTVDFSSEVKLPIPSP